MQYKNSLFSRRSEAATSATFSLTPYSGANSYMFGRSENPNGLGASVDAAVGRNVLDGYVEDVSAAGSTGDAVTATDDTIGAVTYEAALEVGDSSGPMFVDVSGDLTIVGANWILLDTAVADSSGFTYLGNHSDDIQTFIDAHPVPEPSTYALFAGAATLALALARRRR